MDVKSAVSLAKDNLPFSVTPQVIWAARSIAFNPFFWNAVGRFEFKSHFFTKLAGGNKYRACYVFAFVVFSLGLLRDYLFYQALETQPVSPWLSSGLVKVAGVVIALTGQVLALSSMWALGITGTYLGDYFGGGILMKEKVSGFPFNVCDNPMYFGSFLSFLGSALFKGKVVGVALSGLVWLIYRIGLLLEEPFTEKIYSEKNAKYE